MHGQVSEFRAVLRYGLVYGLRARNMRLVGRALLRYMIRVRHKVGVRGTATGGGN